MGGVVHLWHFATKQETTAERRTPIKKAMMISSHGTCSNIPITRSVIRMHERKIPNVTKTTDILEDTTDQYKLSNLKV